AAEVRWNADRAADVAAELERRKAGRHRSGGAAGRSAHGSIGVPGIAADTVYRVEGLPIARTSRQVGLAENVGARFAKQRHRVGFLLGYVVPQRLKPTSGGHSRDFERILDSDRQAGEGAERISAGARLVNRPCSGARAIRVHRRHQVVGRIETLDACQIELKQLHRTDLACVEELQLFGGWRKRKLLIGHWSSPFDQPSKFVRTRARQKPEENIYRTNGAD